MNLGLSKDVYKRQVHNQLSAIFNHAIRYYGLQVNPAQRAGNMGTEERREMLFWTREEYTRFSEAMMDKPISFYAFEMLYWCGIREGELLALTDVYKRQRQGCQGDGASISGRTVYRRAV